MWSSGTTVAMAPQECLRTRAPCPSAGVADDMARVMDANNIERAVLLGHSIGCQVILEFYRLFPDRVLGLVPILGAFGHVADTFIDPRIGRKLYEAAYKVGTSIPDLLNVVTKMTLRKPLTWHFARLSGLVHPDLCRKEDLDPYMEAPCPTRCAHLL